MHLNKQLLISLYQAPLATTNASTYANSSF